jgi:hypothetical protein
MAQAVSCQPLKLEAQVEFEVKKVALKQVLVQVLQFLPVNVSLPMLHTLSVI